VEVISPADLKREGGEIKPSDVSAPGIEYCVHVTVHRVGSDLNCTVSKVFTPGEIDNCAPPPHVMARIIANLEAGIAGDAANANSAADGRKGGRNANSAN
jgi:hypothetical protein